jgi:REP element-mobilizing transposase RayT
MADYPQRRHLAHGVKCDHDLRPIVFVTICTRQRAKLLANATAHELLINAWSEASAWLVGRYVLMPDHAHFFATVSDESLSLDAWIRYWKSQLTKRQRVEKMPGLIAWQSDHWDTRLRSAAMYDAKWDYVRNNPVRKGLVARAEDWPFQGTLHELRWD